MKKILIFLAAALSLSVLAFAYSSNSFVTSVSGLTSNNTTITCDAPSGNAFFFAIENSSTEAKLYGISQTSGAAVRTIIGNNVSNKYCNWAVSGSAGTAYVADNLAYPTVTSISSSIAIFPQNTAVTTVVDEFFGWIANPNPSPAVASSFTVPCGNVLYFKVDREQDVTFTAVMPVLSSLLGTPTGAWNSGIQYGPAAALPTSGTTFPILSQDPINFAKTVSNQNLLGQTKNAISTKHCIAGQYYALYLPYHYGGWLALGSSHVYPDGSTSGGIVGANVTVSGSFAEIKVYPLTEKANGDLLTGSVTLDSGSDDGFASYFDGEISDTGTVTWLDQNGDISSPSVGGTSYVPEDVSTESIIDQIKNILSSIVSEIKNLFSFGYEAVNTLVSLMHDFVGVFKQLYEWLPTEVYSALVSAIIVAITIGVFKVFL